MKRPSTRTRIAPPVILEHPTGFSVKVARRRPFRVSSRAAYLELEPDSGYATRFGFYESHGWGYDYHNQMIWRKPRAPGMGWWLFTEHEVVLIGERGSFRPVERVPSVFDAPVRAHSQKPDEFYALVERMYPSTRRVELFARTKRPGWGEVWGNQV